MQSHARMTGTAMQGTVTTHAAALRAGREGASKLVRDCLDQAEARSDLHAVVHLCGDDALARAAAADRRVQAGDDAGPLHGIRCAVKDTYDVAGLPTRAGAHRHASRDRQRRRPAAGLRLPPALLPRAAGGRPGADAVALPDGGAVPRPCVAEMPALAAVACHFASDTEAPHTEQPS